MFNYFVREEALQSSLMRRVRLVRESKALIAVYFDTQMERLLFPRRSTGFRDMRDLTLLLLLYDTGERAAEACNMRVMDLDLRERTAVNGVSTRKVRRTRRSCTARASARARFPSSAASFRT